MSKQLHWGWTHFYSDNQLFRSNNSYKNAWCLACLNHRQEQLRQSDIISASLTGVSNNRTDADRVIQGSDIDEFSRLLLNLYTACIDCLPISGKPTQTMLPHLSKCTFVAPDIRALAAEEVKEKKNCNRKNPPVGRSVSMPLLSNIATGSSQIPYMSGGWSASVTPSPAPSPLLLSVPLLNLERPLKRARTSSFISPLAEGSGLSSPVPSVPWNPSQQQEFGEDFCKLLIATRSSWNTAHNPQVRLFVEKWIPGAIIPDR